MIEMEALKARLFNYRPPAPGKELWKSELDLTKCGDGEKREIQRLGHTIEDFEREGLNRGQVHHILFGWNHPSRRYLEDLPFC